MCGLTNLVWGAGRSIVSFMCRVCGQVVVYIHRGGEVVVGEQDVETRG